MSLADLTRDWAAFSYGFLDASAKRELRRAMVKAVSIPGAQIPYASREMPMARGWGTGGLPATLTLINPESVIKVIDQGVDDSVNAASIRRFLGRVSGAPETWDTLEATIIQSRHRIPEERLREDQILVLQVPADPAGLAGATRLATANPADALGLKDRGRIAVGLRADLLVADPSGVGHVCGTFVAGREIFSHRTLGAHVAA